MVCAVLLAASPPLALAGCSTPRTLAIDNQGHGIEVIPLKTYVTLQSNFMMWLANVDGVRAINAIDCYRVIYLSMDDSGKPITLSGMLALPHDATPHGLVSFQHGTTSDRDSVPSSLSTDGLAAAILFSGNGYATIAPDYVGLGISKKPHPYYIAQDTERAVVDMIHAVRHIEGVPKSPPLLVGFSEGGYASLAAQRVMEATEEPVLATAAIAGAYNLRSISVPWTLKGASVQASVYLALWVRGYAEHYGHPLDSAFTPYYAKLVPELFDTSHDPDAVVKALPRDPKELFQPAALGALEGRGQHWLVDALTENEMSDWRARAPIRLYYGSNDVDVPPTEATTTARQMATRGSDIQAVATGAQDHNQSVLAAAPMILRWFQTFAPTHPSSADGPRSFYQTRDGRVRCSRPRCPAASSPPNRIPTDPDDAVDKSW